MLKDFYVMKIFFNVKMNRKAEASKQHQKEIKNSQRLCSPRTSFPKKGMEETEVSRQKQK